MELTRDLLRPVDPDAVQILLSEKSNGYGLWVVTIRTGWGDYEATGFSEWEANYRARLRAAAAQSDPASRTAAAAGN